MLPNAHNLFVGCVRCINCSYNNIAKDIRLHDKIAMFVYTVKSSFGRNIPLSKYVNNTYNLFHICQYEYCDIWWWQLATSPGQLKKCKDTR